MVKWRLMFEARRPCCKVTPQHSHSPPFDRTLHNPAGDDVLLKEAHGMAVPELGVPLKVEHIAPIGSNTKLFTAGAGR
jgi:hypothetical protein